MLKDNENKICIDGVGKLKKSKKVVELGKSVTTSTHAAIFLIIQKN